ncbi:hypothetical protein TcBrA4_0034850 [Trypanosoma cruzi]|nr:hypothetical protein TcBrA4_0034850 [Trypanosoma cruzi]
MKGWRWVQNKPIGPAAAECQWYVVGPMVDQSELLFRMLCRESEHTLAYSPMLHARSFAQSAQYRARLLLHNPEPR